MSSSSLSQVPRLPICVGVMVVVLLVGVVAARPSLPADPPYAPPYSQPSYKQGRPYSFRYGVKDDYAGADYGQDETSDGHLVKGSYFVALPDGRLQTTWSLMVTPNTPSPSTAAPSPSSPAPALHSPITRHLQRHFQAQPPTFYNSVTR
ncbi:putative Insect cuticle protein domain-containing protein 13 [Homarus americanus]|uniref:Putative Insect cuticle protein domain-containing protein 13 n=1 Tax=Homarus americanus TaxID=6706 RepID=A0A8J5MSG0_HOMAM|nr:putative Insect cuticle protein domain-containing protein 13 [Homarus americanus]